MAEQKQYRRWYDKDPILREALELLKLQSDNGNSDDSTSEFIIKLQQEVAKDVIDSVYNMVRHDGYSFTIPNSWFISYSLCPIAEMTGTLTALPAILYR